MSWSAYSVIEGISLEKLHNGQISLLMSAGRVTLFSDLVLREFEVRIDSSCFMTKEMTWCSDASCC